ncbi:hypothetical protein LSTR_LSTR007085 [Laodelphax striatellus]|uniref:pseudouridine 5'-phosphatase n=1 Tax=Laodelphax striatellus TaxID=195883 RepID=A0A482WET0_LAOST|nr:hypothetical protein LSTR_LSTR007085 [Laodelphax striatellus]
MNKIAFTSLRYFSSIKSKMGDFKKVTHCIFDMDGLLLDTEGVYKASYEKLLKQYGHIYTEDIRVKVLGTKEQDTAKIIIESYKLPLSVEEFSKESKKLQLNDLSKATLLPGAERLVRHLHQSQVPIAVATSSGAPQVELKTTNHKALFGLFHHIVSASTDAEVVNGKPAPDIFLVAAKRFEDGVKPEQCLVFEDAPNGVQAGRSAGMQVVMVPDPVITEEKRQAATLVLNTLEEFKPELFGLPPFPQ